MALIDYSVEIPDEVEITEMHEAYFQTIEKAMKTFIAKNHDYHSSWRLYDIRSICKEFLVRVSRILTLLDLEESNKASMGSEGIESEFTDMINWAVFGALLRKGYGIDLLDMLSDFTPTSSDVETDEEVDSEVEAPLRQQDIMQRLSEVEQIQLDSPNPYPQSLAFSREDAMCGLEKFVLGNSPFLYVRYDLMYPDQKEDFEKEFPDEVSFIRTSLMQNSAGMPPNSDKEIKSNEDYLSNKDTIQFINKLEGITN